MCDYTAIYRDLIEFADSQGLTVSCAAYCLGMRSGFERRSVTAGAPPGYLAESFARGHAQALQALIGNGLTAVRAG